MGDHRGLWETEGDRREQGGNAGERETLMTSKLRALGWLGGAGSVRSAEW